MLIIGDGPDRIRMGALAGPTVHSIGWGSDEEVADLFSHCQAVVFPGEEDFGIVPLEAQASGRPVIALAAGGALETILPGETGFLVTDGTPRAFADAISRALDYPWDSAAIRRPADGVGRQRFVAQVQ